MLCSLVLPPPPHHLRPGSPGAHDEASIQSSGIAYWPGYEAAILLLVAAVSLSSVSPGYEEGLITQIGILWHLSIPIWHEDKCGLFPELSLPGSLLSGQHRRSQSRETMIRAEGVRGRDAFLLRGTRESSQGSLSLGSLLNNRDAGRPFVWGQFMSGNTEIFFFSRFWYSSSTQNYMHQATNTRDCRW